MAPTHHSLNYTELTVDDLDAAKAFYATAFGWTLNDYGPAYAGIQGETDEVGGLRTDDATTPPLPLVYSTDLEATLKAVTDAGGTVTNGPYDFPGGRRFHFTDPAGNEIGVFTATD